MCGIVGEIAFRGKASGAHENGVFAELVGMMTRRGPDDAGIWSDGSSCTLGFRRLSILDLSTSGHQPMLTRDGRYAIVYNGEVYNFRELRRELERDGARFHSSGDTEVVLQALAHWGAGALERFNGMFALAFYDAMDKRLLLARDHAGIKPLYYMHTSQGLVFASQYDQILAHPWGRKLSVLPDALAMYLRLGYIPAPYALLEKTRMLEPGCRLVITVEGELQRGRFFTFDMNREADLFGDEANEAVDAVVGAAVARQLVSDVPLGTFLSGGIDSPLVTAKARALQDGPIPAFTIGTAGDPLDESADAALYAQQIEVEHVVEQMVPGKALDVIDDVVAACGEPFADYSMFPTLLVSRLARQRVKVVLSGDGGDELFWGYAGRFLSILQATDDMSATDNRWNVKRLFEAGAGAWPANLGAAYQMKHTHFSEARLQNIFPDISDWPNDFPLFDYDGWETDQTARWLRWNEFNGFLTMVLLKVDRASMHESLEVRVPLLDREVIDVAARIDWKSCLDVDGRGGKLPLRRALAGLVPHQTSTKRGFTVPMGDWLRGPLRSLFEESVLGRKDILGLPIDEPSVQALFDRHLAGETGHDMGLWILLSLSLWEEKHWRKWSDNVPGRRMG